MKYYIQPLVIALVFLSTTVVMANQSSVFDYQRFGHVVASPKDKTVAYITIQANSNVKNLKWQSSLYLYTTFTKKTKLITSTNAMQPRWSPDGNLVAFIANGKEHLSIWLYNLKKKSLNKFFESSEDVNTFKWSPDGKQIAFTATNPKTKNLQLYIISAKNKSLPKAITSENIHIRNAGGSDGYIDTGYDWSPNSQSITYAHTENPSANVINESKITIVNLKNKEKHNLPYTTQHTGNQVFYSPNGQWLAFSSNLPPQKSATRLADDAQLNNRICVANLQSMKSHCLANTFDKNPMILGWNKLSNKIYVNDFYKTTGMQFYSISLNNSIEPIQLSHHYGNINPLSITLNRGRTTFGFALETDALPPEAYTAPTKDFTLKQISHLQITHKTPVGKSKIVRWKSFDEKNN